MVFKDKWRYIGDDIQSFIEKGLITDEEFLAKPDKVRQESDKKRLKLPLWARIMVKKNLILHIFLAILNK